ncbi:hypothetical protein Tco_0973511 [Tanacetum coccineum]
MVMHVLCDLDSFEDIIKAQVSVIKASATLNIQAFKIKKSVSISFRMTQVHKLAKDHMMMIKDYDWMMISKKLKDHIQETNVISIADSEETLMLEEESRSKMLLKQSDTMVLEKKLNIKPVNYAELNRLSEDFGKCFVPQQELSDEQAFRKLKGKEIADNAAQVSNATTIAPGMYKLDLVILDPKVKNNKETHEYYLKHTIEQAVILRKVVEQAKSQNPLDSESYSACTYVKLIQELLGYVRDTCPDIHKPRVNPSTSASGSKPLGNTKNDRISRTPSSNEKNKHIVKGVKALCSICNECLFIANHVMCLIDYVNSMNMLAKSASKKNKKRKERKPTGKVFNSIGYKWKPTGRTFTLVGNACLLTRLTTTNKVPLRVSIPLEVVAPKQVVTRVYSRRPKVPKCVQNSKPKVSKSMTTNRMKPGTYRGFNTSVALSSSSLIDCRLSKLFYGIWTPDAPST